MYDASNQERSRSSLSPGESNEIPMRVSAVTANTRPSRVMSSSTIGAGISATVRSLLSSDTAYNAELTPALLPPNQISSPFGAQARLPSARQPRERTRFL